jgi:hypothetical protein
MAYPLSKQKLFSFITVCLKRALGLAQKPDYFKTGSRPNNSGGEGPAPGKNRLR